MAVCVCVCVSQTNQPDFRERILEGKEFLSIIILDLGVLWLPNDRKSWPSQIII